MPTETRPPLSEGYIPINIEGKPLQTSTTNGFGGINWNTIANGEAIGGFPSSHAFPEEHGLDMVRVWPSPVGCDVSELPARLIKVGIPNDAARSTPYIQPQDIRYKNPDSVLTAKVVKLGTEDARTMLGPQAPTILAMVRQIFDHYDGAADREMARRAQVRRWLLMCQNSVIDIAREAGRFSDSLLPSLLWLPPYGNPHIHARNVVRPVFTAVMYRDLLVEQGEWERLGDSLYRPWREVLGDPVE